jgi:hypothetical protein
VGEESRRLLLTKRDCCQREVDEELRHFLALVNVVLHVASQRDYFLGEVGEELHFRLQPPEELHFQQQQLLALLEQQEV